MKMVLRIATLLLATQLANLTLVQAAESEKCIQKSKVSRMRLYAASEGLMYCATKAWRCTEPNPTTKEFTTKIQLDEGKGDRPGAYVWYFDVDQFVVGDTFVEGVICFTPSSKPITVTVYGQKAGAGPNDPFEEIYFQDTLTPDNGGRVVRRYYHVPICE